MVYPRHQARVVAGRIIATMTTILAETFSDFYHYLDRAQKTKKENTIIKVKFRTDHADFIAVRDAISKRRNKLSEARTRISKKKLGKHFFLKLTKGWIYYSNFPSIRKIMLKYEYPLARRLVNHYIIDWTFLLECSMEQMLELKTKNWGQIAAGKSTKEKIPDQI